MKRKQKILLMCAGTISALESDLLKTFQAKVTGVQHKSIGRDGSRGRKNCCPGNYASSEWKL